MQSGVSVWYGFIGSKPVCDSGSVWYGTAVYTRWFSCGIYGDCSIYVDDDNASFKGIHTAMA